MFHPDHRPAADTIRAVQELILGQRLQPHQIAAAAHPETDSKRLTAKRKPSRQALERKANDQLSAGISKTD